MMNKNWVAVLAGLALLSVPACAAEVETGTGTAAFRAGDLIEFRAPEPVKMISADEMGIMFDAMSGYTPEEQTLVINDGTYFHYYERLDPMAREMYDIMLEVAKDPVSEDNLGLMMTTIDLEPGGAHTPGDVEPDRTAWHERDGAAVRTGERQPRAVPGRGRRDEPRD